MSPIIRIPEPVYDKLQSIAEPFIDTPASVIERLVDFYEVRASDSAHASDKEKKQYVPNDDILRLNPEYPPSLIHTRIIKAKVGDFDAHNWNDLVHASYREALLRTGSIETVAKICASKIMKGSYTESGYIYYKDIDMSIQGVNSNAAWKYSFQLAQKLDFGMRVIFQWRKMKGASNPGKKGIFEWNPKSSSENRSEL
jgi:hypothetical protein